MFVRRAINIAFDTAFLKNKTRTVFGSKTYTNFQNIIIEPHNKVHVHAQCDMESPLAADYDPILWLLHSYADRQFAFWQEVNKLRNTYTKKEIENFEDMGKLLNPFYKPEYNQVRDERIIKKGSEEILEYI